MPLAIDAALVRARSLARTPTKRAVPGLLRIALDHTTGHNRVSEEDALMATTRKAGGGKRELLKSAAGKTFTKRRADGTFKEHDAVGRSLATDRRRKAKTKVAAGHGDRGDR